MKTKWSCVKGLKFPSMLLQTNLIADNQVTGQLTSEPYRGSYITSSMQEVFVVELETLPFPVPQDTPLAR
jgi:hypothetical protein